MPLQAVLLFGVAVLARRVFSPVIEADRDVGLYAVQAREWLRGGWPYLAVWDLHPPGEPALVALAFAVLGESVTVLRLLGAACVAGCGLVLVGLVRVATGSRGWGLVAGLAYVMYSPLSGGAAVNNELVLAPFVASGMALMLRRAGGMLRGGALRAPGLVLPGLCFGMALWIKQVAAPEAMAGFAGLVLLALWLGRTGPARLPGLALAFGMAAAAPTGLCALAYAVKGGLGEYVAATIVAPLGYNASGRSLTAFLEQGAGAAARFAPLLVLALLAAVSIGRRWPAVAMERRMVAGGALLWLLAALVGAAMPPESYGHHFLVLLPPLAVLATLGLHEAWCRVACPRPWRGPWGRVPWGRVGFALAALLFLGVVPAMAARFHARAALAADPLDGVARAMRAAGATPADTAFVVNANPVIYLLAGVRVPGRFVFPDHLVEAKGGTIPGLDGDAEVARILARAPRFIVVDRGGWATMRGAVRDMVGRAAAAEYALVARVPDGGAGIEVHRRLR